MRKQSLIFGIGINNSNHPVRVNGKHLKAYTTWHSILLRCYSSKCHNKRPTYIKCSVCEEWLRYSNFEKWHELNYREGYVIDKDILISGNTVYSPETCRFVPLVINNLLLTKSDSGEYIVGVSKENRRNKYRAGLSKYGKNINLGYYETPEEAHEVWRLAKIEYVGEIARAYLFSGEISEEIFDALVSRDFR